MGVWLHLRKCLFGFKTSRLLARAKNLSIPELQLYLTAIMSVWHYFLKILYSVRNKTNLILCFSPFLFLLTTLTGPCLKMVALFVQIKQPTFSICPASGYSARCHFLIL